MKIVTVVGARPQFVKAATVSRAFIGHGGVAEVLVHTGQHYDDNMSAVFFDQLGIPAPAHQLHVGSASHGAQTGRMLEAIESVLGTERPDAVLVYGDTNSTLAGALAASKLHIPVAHVEAGLRSFNRRMPEEVNRVLTDHVSDLLLPPTATATANLLAERLGGRRICQVGDVMYDAALYFRQGASRDSDVLDRLGLRGRPYVLVTIHRAENTDHPERLGVVVEALVALAAGVQIVMPVHPRTRRAIDASALASHPGVTLIEPVSYLDMVELEASSSVIVTDSGGVQKEAFFFRVPCVTVRDETEWVELVDCGWNVLVPPQAAAPIIEAVRRVLDGARPAEWPQALYGSGDAAEKVVSECLAMWG